MKKRAWIYKVFLLTFILSILFSAITNFIAYNTNLVIMLLIIIIVISIGIMFDMIGTSVLTVKESVFHAMSSQKIEGAKEAIGLIKNKEKFANLCNDVIGDICGIVSGGLGAVLAIEISKLGDIDITLSSILVAAFISSMTVGGKAIFKTVATKNSEKIIYSVSRIKSKLRIKN